MDFKSLKRAREGKKDRNDVKARAAALRQKRLQVEAAAKREAAREEAARAALIMPPPPPRALAPKATRKVGSLVSAAPAPARETAAAGAPAGLPAGFFDAGGVALTS